MTRKSVCVIQGDRFYRPKSSLISKLHVSLCLLKYLYSKVRRNAKCLLTYAENFFPGQLSALPSDIYLKSLCNSAAVNCLEAILCNCVKWVRIPEGIKVLKTFRILMSPRSSRHMHDWYHTNNFSDGKILQHHKNSLNILTIPSLIAATTTENNFKIFHSISG
jgi:hypothetical protein